MNADSTMIRESRRVPRHKIRRLYESDARGMLDEELLDDVGYGIYARCQDIIDFGGRKGQSQVLELRQHNYAPGR